VEVAVIPIVGDRGTSLAETALVQRENERLTRLLRNLNQEFKLGHGDRSRLYEHICRELAQYFRCDCCQLFLVRQEEEGADRCAELLVLTAAFGPWEQALRPRFSRRVIRTQYNLHSDAHTAQRFRSTRASVDLCRAAYGRENKKDPRDAEWHLVWPRNNLYNVSRNIISCPILRHRSKGELGPYPIGLIKLENRRPTSGRAFESDCQPGELYLGHYYELCSVAAYVRDLEKRLSAADTLDALFAPLHDGDGWRQHYQAHPQGERYFDEVRGWLDEGYTRHKKGTRKKAANDLREQYVKASGQLSQVLDLIVEAEVLFQALETALTELSTGPAQGSGNNRGAPAPSLFNVVGLKRTQFGTPVWATLREALERAVPGIKSTKIDQPKQACWDLVSHIDKSTTGPSRAQPSTGLPAGAQHDLWGRLTREFQARNGRGVLLLDPTHREDAARHLCQLLATAAEVILDGRSKSGAGDLFPDVLACYQCAQKVKEKLEGGPGPQRAEASKPVVRLAEALAAACAYAHTFDPLVDEARLYSIQSHVSQIIDNHFLERARCLEVTFDQLEQLGLTESSIEQLELLDKRLRDAGRHLTAAVRRRAAEQLDGQEVAQVNPCKVRDILQTLTDAASKQRPEEDEKEEAQKGMRRRVLADREGPLRDGRGGLVFAEITLLEARFRDEDEKGMLRSVLADRERGLNRFPLRERPGRLSICYGVRHGELYEAMDWLGEGAEKWRPRPAWLFHLNAALEGPCDQPDRLDRRP
jgi:hypothetical protein